MKVLFTGMASSHCTRPANVTFFRTLADVVSEFAEVTWAAPKLSWTKEDLEKFDAIIFGLTPPTSLSANKIYGAMHVLGLMYHSPKLRLVVDGQQIWQYKNSVEAVKRDVNTLFSSFFSKRFGYAEARGEKRKYIELAASYLNSGNFPKIYYPRLPWNSNEKAAAALGFVSTDNLTGISVDSMLLSQEPYSISDAPDFWSVEDTKRPWFNLLEPTLRFDSVDVRLSKTVDDALSGRTIRQSMALIVPPQERKTGTWWSYKYIQAINSNTPVVTMWQESQNLDHSWAYLAYQIEDMNASERRVVARNQLESYYEAVPSRTRLINELREEMLNSVKERI